MNFLADTNIILLLGNNSKFGDYFERHFSQIAEDSNGFIAVSVVTKGELESLALQRKWGDKKIQVIQEKQANFLTIDIKYQKVIKAYGQIDAFSQGKLAGHPLPKGMSARNMGKNDLWIAACASVIDATLITTDQDFDHLHEEFLNRELVDVEKFKE